MVNSISNSSDTVAPHLLNLVRGVGLLSSASMASKAHRQQLSVNCGCGGPMCPEGPRTIVGDVEKEDEMDGWIVECEARGWIFTWDNLGDNEEHTTSYDTEFEDCAGFPASGPWLTITEAGESLLREHFPKEMAEWDACMG